MLQLHFKSYTCHLLHHRERYQHLFWADRPIFKDAKIPMFKVVESPIVKTANIPKFEETNMPIFEEA